jgi:hypothetical protein
MTVLGLARMGPGREACRYNVWFVSGTVISRSSGIILRRIDLLNDSESLLHPATPHFGGRPGFKIILSNA